jgi:hypothetical protein
MKSYVFWDIMLCSATEVSEEYITSIFRAKNKPSKKPGFDGLHGIISPKTELIIIIYTL